MKRLTSIDLMRAACIVLSAALTAGCAVPGWQLDADSDSDWFSDTDPRHPDTEMPEDKEYDPVVREITPSLISRMKQNKAGEPGAATGTAQQPPEQPEHQQYRIGRGDLLAVIVYGHPDITNPAGTTQNVETSGRLVDSEGEIYVPFIGNMNVAGDTVDEIRQKITKGLSKVIRNPQVDVKVLQYRSKKIYVTGDISRPCTIPIRDLQLTVVDALDACQSLLSERDPGVSGVNAVQLVRNDNVYPLNLSQLYRQGGDPVVLQDGDRLIVDDTFNRIFLIGEFNEQTAAAYSAGGMTLSDAIAAAGGLNVETADPGGIYVIRGFVDKNSDAQSGLETKVRPRVYHLDANSVDALILADQFNLQPRDVVYAAPASMVNFNRALSQITPSLDLLFRSWLIYDRSSDN